IALGNSRSNPGESGGDDMKNDLYDVAIIGGGPAGLEASLVLARTRKRIIVFDDPQPARNSASHGVHNLLGLDGLRPAEIREIAWKQIAMYQSAEHRRERVTNIGKADNDYFDVTGEIGSSIRAKHVILAVGYHDVYPAIPGFAECWGHSIIPCPYCDGYEHRDRVWGVVATSARDALHFPALAQNWTSDIKLLVQPDVSLDPVYQDNLIASGIAVHAGEITHIHHRNGNVEGVSLATGERIAVDTLLWVPPKEPVPLVRTLADQLGLAVDDEGYVITDDSQRTNVARLWAAGDVQNGRWALDAVYTGGTVANMIIRTWYQ
ncbi:MAG TPA: NAD(P)/FAD-dependent oxidoreductase, partial [Ktedonobacterales bacterium]|nr:NAD(P)/FAD-dependent oxidoreductase [Ktedonobacterales bacterium]